MFKQKYLISIVLSLLIFAVGCSGGSQSSQGGEGSSAGSTLTITANSGEVANNLNNHADRFMEENPEIEVEVIEYPEEQYKDQARSLFTSSEKPDLAWFVAEDNFFQMAEAGVFEPLDELYEENGWNEVLPQSTLELFTSSDGSKYGVNTDVVWTPVLYYNEGVFEEVGIEPPTTFEELYEIGGKLKEAGYIPLSSGNGEGWVTGHLFNTLLSRHISDAEYNQMIKIGANPDEVSFEDPSVVDAWREMEKMREELFPEGTAGISDNEARSLFVQGKAAMYSQGSWAAGDANLGSELPEEFELGYVFYPPIHEDIEPKVNLGVGNSLMILKDTENMEEAKKFITFVMSKESQIETARTVGFFPSRTDIDIQGIEGLNPMIADQYQKMQEIGTQPLFSDVIPAKMQSKLFEVNQSVLSGTLTPEEAAAEMEAMKSEIESMQ